LPTLVWGFLSRALSLVIPFCLIPSFLVQFLCSTAEPFLRPDHARRQ
jgi:hypothetical protein